MHVHKEGGRGKKFPPCRQRTMGVKWNKIVAVLVNTCILPNSPLLNKQTGTFIRVLVCQISNPKAEESIKDWERKLNPAHFSVSLIEFVSGFLTFFGNGEAKHFPIRLRFEAFQYNFSFLFWKDLYLWFWFLLLF